MEAVETCVRRQALAIAARLLAGHRKDDRTDYQGATLPCDCGEVARYKGRRRKTFLTALGPMELERAYYHCPACRRGSFPRDESLQLAHAALSPAGQRMCAASAAVASFVEASGLIRELAGLPLGTQSVERTAERLGREVAAQEVTDLPTAAVAAPAPAVYLGMDGIGLPMRKGATAGRPGTRADGTSRTHEIELVLMWTAETRDEDDRPRRDPGSVTYSGAIESAATGDLDPELSASSQRVRREAERRAFGAAERQVVSGDGAAWIWKMAAELFPGAVEIVDGLHAKERLWGVAKDLFGGQRERLEEWAEARCEELAGGSSHALLQALRAARDSSAGAAECVANCEKQRERMRYPEFREAGLCVGSGVVEAGCKTVAAVRLKQAGMH